jgi:VIT1/CCC1 family predicted Fe2+/Mn2+ transporter
VSAFVVLAYPKGNQFNADSNLLPGPLWLVSQSRSSIENRLVGFATAIPSLLAVVSVIIWPRWYTALAASIGVGLWFAMAVWIAMITAA